MFRIKRGCWFLFTLLAIGMVANTPAQANLIINPTFDSSITGDPNSAAIQATINLAISVYEAKLLDPITVNITFKEGGGLGGSNFSLFGVTYASYYNAFRTHLSLSKDAPVRRPIQRYGQLATRSILGGLHHQYWRI